MALATRKSGDIHNKSGGDLAAMKAKYDNNKQLDYIGFDEVDALLYQIQLLREDIDELRRYIVSAELLQPDTMGDNLPTSDPRTAGQLWSNRGVVTVSS
tara:strand:+ start:259 stop:555 length:297 start_codon:yes stop_codon:yes gene_type:complete